MTTSKIKELANILNSYEDIEKDIYFLIENHLLNSGISFAISNLTFKHKQCFIMGQFQKSNISFVELLSHGFYITGHPEMELVESGRMNPKKPLLFHDEVVALTFSSKNSECNEIRIINLDINEGHIKTKPNNLFFGLPESFLNIVNKNQELTITVKIISQGNYRKTFKENAMFNHTDVYANKLKNKKNLFLNNYNKSDLSYINHIKHRALLWGVDFSNLTIEEMELKYRGLPNSDFGIKNITALRAFFNRFNDSNISNDNLFNENKDLNKYLQDLYSLYDQLNNEQQYVIIHTWKNLFS